MNLKKGYHMNCWLTHPAIQHASEMDQICRPLLKLNITYFAHVRINKEKKFSAIANNPLYTEHYLRNKYYTADIHMIDANQIGEFVVWDAIQFTGIGQKICEESGKLGMHNPFTILKKSENKTDYYHFAAAIDNKENNQRYLANIDLLELFIAYFNEKMADSKTLSRAYDISFDMVTPQPIMMTPFANSFLVCDKWEFEKNIQSLKKVKRSKRDELVLSKRQKEILHWVGYGKTIKEIAKILNLSPRTVGHYFETIKSKFNVNTKSELITKATDSRFIKLNL